MFLGNVSSNIECMYIAFGKTQNAQNYWIWPMSEKTQPTLCSDMLKILLKPLDTSY